MFDIASFVPVVGLKGVWLLFQGAVLVVQYGQPHGKRHAFHGHFCFHDDAEFGVIGVGQVGLGILDNLIGSAGTYLLEFSPGIGPGEVGEAVLLFGFVVDVDCVERAEEIGSAFFGASDRKVFVASMSKGMRP